MNILQKNMALAKTELAYAYFRFRSQESSKRLKELAPRFNQAFEDIKTKGVAVIENYYTPEQCEVLCAEIDRLIGKYHDKIWTDAQKSDHRIFGAEKFSPLIHDFAYDRHIQDFGEKYIETSLKLTMTLAARLDYIPGNAGSGGGWHRDSVIFNEFKSILYLTDVEISNGPFTFMHGSQNQKSVKAAIREANVKYDQYRFSEEQAQRILQNLGLHTQTFTAKKGSLILVDTRGIHIGSPIQQGHRYALTNYYAPAFRYERMMAHSQKVILKDQ